MKYIETILNEIPSGLLREHLKENPPDWTLLQWAAVSDMFMGPNEQAKLFTQMLPLAETDYEKALLEAAIQDIKNVGHVDNLSLSVYDAAHPGNDPPDFPFLECIGLPILLKKGELTKARWGNETEAYLVWGTPENLPRWADLTDESYYCYSLDDGVPEDLEFIHAHVHICVADACLENELSDSQKIALGGIRQKLTGERT